MRSFLAASLISAIAASTSATAKGPINTLQIGNWRGGSYTNDQTGQFSNCIVSTSYNSGISVVVLVTANLQWQLGFAHPKWTLTPGKAIPVALTFDGRGPVNLYARPITTELAVVDMPDNGALIRAFRAAQMMTAYAEGNLFQFRLTDTSRMLPALVQCAKNGGDTTFAKLAPKPPLSGSRVVANVSTPSPSQPAENKEAAAEKNKLLTEAAAEHQKCLRSQMRSIVPYSNENAETLAQVVLTKCAEAENRFVSLGMALFNSSREEVQKIVGNALAKQKANMVADIVTFRAELAKAMATQPKEDQRPTSQSAKDSGI